MQMNLIEKNKDKTKYCFLIKGFESYILNALRRSAITLVPVMAIENVEIRKNSSLLYDEVLAHRLGLVPLKTDLKHYKMIEKPEDEESLKCTVKFTLKAKGPKTVYAKEMKSADPAVVPIYEDIPIVKLAKGQELALEATAILGQGKTHMKWSPGIIYYKNKPIVEIKSNVDTDKLKQLLPPNSAVKIQGNKASVDENKLYTTSFFDSYVNETLMPGVKVSMVDDEYVLNLESFGQLSVKDWMLKSIDMLKDKIDEFESKLSK